MAQASEMTTEPRRAKGRPAKPGRPEGAKDGPDVKRWPDVRLSAIMTAIRAANEAGFDLTVDKVRGIVLTPKEEKDQKEPPE